MAWGNQKTRYGRILLEHLLVTRPRTPAVLARNLNIVGNPIYKISPTFTESWKRFVFWFLQWNSNTQMWESLSSWQSAFLYEATLCLLYHQGQCLWQTGTPSLCKEDSPLEKPPSHLGPHTATESHATLWGLRNTPLRPWSLSNVACFQFFKCVLGKSNLRSSPRHCLFGCCGIIKWTTRQTHEALPAGICVVWSCIVL